VVASYFIVVDGRVAGHGVVTETSPEGIKEEKALVSFLNDAAVVWLAPRPGLTRSSLTFGRSILQLLRGLTTHRRINFYPMTAPRYTFLKPAF